MISLLTRDEADGEVVRWRQARDASPLVRRLRAKQLSDGSFPAMPWRHTHTYEFNQLVLMGFGLEDPTVKRGVESLFRDQVADGGFNVDRRTARGVEKSRGGWHPCTTVFMTKTLLDLGMRKDPRVKALVALLKRSQQDSGGWICQRFERRSPYCILAATPWALSVLAASGLQGRMGGAARSAVELIERHKRQIMKHGYQRDLCYRCDEALVLPSLQRLGLDMEDRLFADLHKSLAAKQTADGHWCFRGKPSAWYTLEAAAALQAMRERQP